MRPTLTFQPLPCRRGHAWPRAATRDNPPRTRSDHTCMRQWVSRATIMGLLLLMVPSAVLARQGAPPISRRQVVRPLNTVALVALSAVDTKALVSEDTQTTAPGPLPYAIPVTVNITPQTHGTWEQLPDGSRLWRLRLAAPGATDLNVGFSRFWLPPQATLYVSSEAEDYYEGPYTERDHKPHGQLWLPVVPGDHAVIELFIPATSMAEPEITLSQVGMGYRDLFRRQPHVKQGSCNTDIICPAGDPWHDQSRSVGLYSINGFLACTGTLIMDVPGSFRPFFLTAHHCGLNTDNAASVVVYWNFESPVCGELGGGSLADNQTGATFRASNADVDFALLELDDMPDATFGVFYSGWDRSGATPQGSVTIHHPGGDEKAISFNDDPLTTGDNCIGPSGQQTHWYVDNWEEGTTEPGSSGAGLWAPSTKQLVGFLSGGFATCSTHGYDCYGKFAVAWDLGMSASQRLRDWLDPDAQGVLSVEGMDPALPVTVRGTVAGLRLRRVICRNHTTGQLVRAALLTTSWDCEALGLVVHPGDRVSMHIIGMAY
jgi:lysyl endopeptidase